MAAAGAALLVGCSDAPEAAPQGGATFPTAAPAPAASASGSVPASRPGAPDLSAPQTIATGLEAPWGLAFLPDGSALVSERDSADILQIPAGGGAPRRVYHVDGVSAQGEGGLLGLAVDPEYARNKYVYAYFTADSDNRIIRFTLAGGTPRVILDGIDKAGIHNGGRIAFGPDGMLYIATGDASEPPLSQDKRSLNGKILRVTPEGKVPAGNPFRTAVWSLGHRNVQGLAWDSRKRLWASEFGQNTWDELNQIVPGRNYGWPLVEGRERRRGMTLPFVQWRPEDASPSGVAVLGPTVYVAGLRGRRLWAVPTGGGRLQALLTEEYGRLRAVAAAPDGSLWVATSNTDGRAEPRRGDDRILRLR